MAPNSHLGLSRLAGRRGEVDLCLANGPCLEGDPFLDGDSCLDGDFCLSPSCICLTFSLELSVSVPVWPDLAVVRVFDFRRALLVGECACWARLSTSLEKDTAFASVVFGLGIDEFGVSSGFLGSPLLLSVGRRGVPIGYWVCVFPEVELASSVATLRLSRANGVLLAA